MVASLGVYALPLLAITAIGVLLSTVTRNSAGAVVGALMTALLMQLIGILPGVGAIKPYLLTTQFDAWHGFLRTPIDWAADHARRLGLRDLRRRGAGWRLPRLPAAGRRRRLAPGGDRCLSPATRRGLRRVPSPRRADGPTDDEWPQFASQQSHPEKDPNMLWTILIIVLIVLVVMAIFGRGRFSR